MLLAPPEADGNQTISTGVMLRTFRPHLILRHILAHYIHTSVEASRRDSLMSSKAGQAFGLAYIALLPSHV